MSMPKIVFLRVFQTSSNILKIFWNSLDLLQIVLVVGNIDFESRLMKLDEDERESSLHSKIHFLTSTPFGGPIGTSTQFKDPGTWNLSEDED